MVEDFPAIYWGVNALLGLLYALQLIWMGGIVRVIRCGAAAVGGGCLRATAQRVGLQLVWMAGIVCIISCAVLRVSRPLGSHERAAWLLPAGCRMHTSNL